MRAPWNERSGASVRRIVEHERIMRPTVRVCFSRIHANGASEQRFWVANWLFWSVNLLNYTGEFYTHCKETGLPCISWMNNIKMMSCNFDMNSRIQMLFDLTWYFVARRQSWKSINLKGLCCEDLAVLSQFKSLLYFTHEKNASLDLWKR